MGLHTIGAADDQHGSIQNGHDTLRFRGKIHVTGGVHQCDIQRIRGGQCLLGKNSDAPLALQAVGVQKSIAVVHTAKATADTALIEQCLGKSGLSGVHMGQQPDTARRFPLLGHKNAPFHKSLRPLYHDRRLSSIEKPMFLSDFKT